MRIFLKRNKYLLGILSIILIFVIIFSIVYYLDYLKIKEASIKNINYCNENFSNDICNQFSVYKKPDTLTVFTQAYVEYNLLRIFTNIAYPIFIIIPVVFGIYSELRTGYIKNKLTRTTFKKHMFKTYLVALKNIIILPFFILILFIASFILSGGNMDILHSTMLSFEEEYLNNILLFGAIFVINIILLNWYIINLAYIITIKSNHIISAIIGSYLGFWIVWIITEVLIGHSIELHFHVKNLTNSLCFSSFWTYDFIISLGFMVGFAVTLVIISSLIAYFVSKNKEKVFLGAEKTI